MKLTPFLSMCLDAAMKLRPLYWIKVILALPVAILFGAVVGVVCLLPLVGCSLTAEFEPGEETLLGGRGRDFREARRRP